MLRPWLEDKINHSWVDPRSFKDDQEFARAYNVAWGFAQAAEQILGFIDQQVDQAAGLTAKEKGEVINKLRDGLS